MLNPAKYGHELVGNRHYRFVDGTVSGHVRERHWMTQSGEYLLTIVGAYGDAEGVEELRRALASLSIADATTTARR